MVVLPLLRGRLAALARRYRVPGVQLAIHRAGETVTMEVGEVECRRGARVTRQTAFPVGSISKSFTATAAMVLVADGDLDLDEPLDGQLPELGDLGGEVTLRHLLSHTAGLASGPSSEELAGVSARRYLVEHCGRHNMLTPPGVNFSYSNLGYVLVGRLIEAITGMSWREAMESILLRPMGIEPAFVDDAADAGARRAVAVGHSVHPDSGRTRAVRQSLAPAEAPAGGLAVSAEDLVTLGTLHIGPGQPAVLPPEYAEEMRQPVPGADPCGLADGWGLGLAVFTGAAVDWVGHDGNAHGTSCYLRVAPASGCAVALTSNSNSGSGLWPDLLAELAQAGILPLAQPRDGQPAPAVPAPPGCAGTYTNGDVEYAVEVQQGHPHLAVDGGTPARLICHDGFTFSMRDPTSNRQVLSGRFMRDRDTGEIDAILVGGRLARRHTHPTRQAGQRLIA
jgi:CubicO group peptidase (beta-lactamase class C family)